MFTLYYKANYIQSIIGEYSSEQRIHKQIWINLLFKIFLQDRYLPYTFAISGLNQRLSEHVKINYLAFTTKLQYLETKWKVLLPGSKMCCEYNTRLVHTTCISHHAASIIIKVMSTSPEKVAIPLLTCSNKPTLNILLTVAKVNKQGCCKIFDGNRDLYITLRMI